jgi:hypothetical protein
MGLVRTRRVPRKLRNRAVARGLITFLRTFTTVGIAIILAVSTIFGSSGDDSDKRFDNQMRS